MTQQRRKIERNLVILMMSNDFEEAFGNFLERKEYDEAESAVLHGPRRFPGGLESGGRGSSGTAKDF